MVTTFLILRGSEPCFRAILWGDESGLCFHLITEFHLLETRYPSAFRSPPAWRSNLTPRNAPRNFLSLAIHHMLLYTTVGRRHRHACSPAHHLMLCPRAPSRDRRLCVSNTSLFIYKTAFHTHPTVDMLHQHHRDSPLAHRQERTPTQSNAPLAHRGVTAREEHRRKENRRNRMPPTHTAVSPPGKNTEGKKTDAIECPPAPPPSSSSSSSPLKQRPPTGITTHTQRLGAQSMKARSQLRSPVPT